MSFETRPIGQTGVHVTSVSFGCAPIGNLYRAITEHQAREVLDAAWAAGIRYFDTAPHYGRGLSEQRLGHFLSDKVRSQYVVSTKVGRVLFPGEQHAERDGFIDPLPHDVRYDYSGDGIEAALEGSRSRLGMRYIDIVYVHDIGTLTHGTANAGHMDAFLGDGYERLVRLKERGEIGAMGLGVNENEVCLDILNHHPLDVILLAGRLSLLDRSAESQLVPLCRAAGTSLVLGGVFNSGILATGPVDGATYNYAPASGQIIAQVAQLQKTSEAAGFPLATAALKFAQTHPQTTSVLIGTTKVSALIRNIEALQTPMTDRLQSVFV